MVWSTPIRYGEYSSSFFWLNKSVSCIFLSNLVLPDSVPELIFWHIPSQAYNKVAPQFGIHKPCVGSINKENVSSQAAELGIMELLVKRPSVKVSTHKRACTHKYIHFKDNHAYAQPYSSVNI